MHQKQKRGSTEVVRVCGSVRWERERCDRCGGAVGGRLGEGVSGSERRVVGVIRRGRILVVGRNQHMRRDVGEGVGGKTLRTECREESSDVAVSLAGKKSLFLNGLFDKWHVH